MAHKTPPTHNPPHSVTPSTPTVASPTPARHGRLNVCALCRQPAVTHFDTVGRWLGCTEANTDTIFALVPVAVHQDGDGQPSAVSRAQRFIGRRLQQARHYAVAGAAPPPPKRANQDGADTRTITTVLKAVAATSEAGALTAEIRTATGLTNNQIQVALKALRRHALIVSSEAAPTKP